MRLTVHFVLNFSQTRTLHENVSTVFFLLLHLRLIPLFSHFSDDNKKETEASLFTGQKIFGFFFLYFQKSLSFVNRVLRQNLLCKQRIHNERRQPHKYRIHTHIRKSHITSHRINKHMLGHTAKVSEENWVKWETESENKDRYACDGCCYVEYCVRLWPQRFHGIRNAHTILKNKPRRQWRRRVIKRKGNEKSNTLHYMKSIETDKKRKWIVSNDVVYSIHIEFSYAVHIFLCLSVSFLTNQLNSWINLPWF